MTPTAPVAIDDIADKLFRLRSLFDAGAITAEEHAVMREAVLKRV